MYIVSGFWSGVLATLFVEMALALIGIVSTCLKYGRNEEPKNPTDSNE